jgi:hypothetical protein
MKTKTQIAREKEMIKELDNLDISIKFKCPNTGNMVKCLPRGIIHHLLPFTTKSIS